MFMARVVVCVYTKVIAAVIVCSVYICVIARDGLDVKAENEYS